MLAVLGAAFLAHGTAAQPTRLLDEGYPETGAGTLIEQEIQDTPAPALNFEWQPEAREALVGTSYTLDILEEALTHSMRLAINQMGEVPTKPVTVHITHDLAPTGIDGLATSDGTHATIYLSGTLLQGGSPLRFFLTGYHESAHCIRGQVDPAGARYGRLISAMLEGTYEPPNFEVADRLIHDAAAYRMDDERAAWQLEFDLSLRLQGRARYQATQGARSLFGDASEELNRAFGGLVSAAAGTYASNQWTVADQRNRMARRLVRGVIEKQECGSAITLEDVLADAKIPPDLTAMHIRRLWELGEIKKDATTGTHTFYAECPQ